MVTIQETELIEKGVCAINRAKQLGRPILLSEVHQVEPTDPLFFFQIGKQNYFGERFFWKDPSDEIILAGIGIAKQIQSDDAFDRFFYVEKNWKDFLKESIILNPFAENAVGPLMFGGFSFDPYKPKTGLWSKFADSLFHIPQYMLSIIKGKTYLTTNIVCTQHDDLELLQKVTSERNQLLTSLKHRPATTSANLIKTEEISPNEWKASVDEIVNDLTSGGSLKKVVLARELRLYFDHTIEAESVLFRLLKEQQESFIFAFEANGDCFIGASPERLVKKQENDVFSTCLAGSISRGRTEAEDHALGEELLNDHKNLVEHQYVVEMIKEALEESCEQVILPDKPQLMKMRDIQHLYTPVIGKSKKETSLLLFVERLHPTPALGGLPKKEAVEKIRQVEELDRGFYAAPLGWMDYKGNGEFAVSIRSGLVQGNEASLFAGCGVVANSNSESEYLETGLKFRPMLRALGGK
ncbi:isochorismate synthase MenF [Bacillota bacterium Lsc_1132]